MTFYFKPPWGTISLQSLQQCISERVKYLELIESLEDISNFEEPIDFQYVTDGTAFDRTGHFMLRLLSLKVSSIHNFYLKYETVLFEKRLQSLEPFNVRVELKTAQRHLREMFESFQTVPKYDIFLKTFQSVCQKLTQRDWANHGFTPEHSDDCELYILDVPFSTCLQLISKREVEIKGSIASIPCGRWRSFLSCLFQTHLDFGIYQLKMSPTIEETFYDSRLQQIVKTCNSFFRSYKLGKHGGCTLKASDIDSQNNLFPPCMASLHRILRKRHRLSHEARFHYSLFLKDIGLPLNEAADFWKTEYLQPHTGCTACSHSWQKDGKRYTYGIRHLYGLEGARRNYKTPHCRKLQGLTLGPKAEGGCPFVHHDDSKFSSSLCDEVLREKDTVKLLLQISKTEGPQNACQKYFSIVLNSVSKETKGEKKSLNSDEKVDTPVDFYLKLASLK